MRVETREHLYIGGEWVAPSGTGTIDVISPYTEQVIARVPEGTTADIDRAVAAARTAFDDGPWSRMTPQERAGYLGQLSALIQSRMDAWATVITSEVGAPFG